MRNGNHLGSPGTMNKDKGSLEQFEHHFKLINEELGSSITTDFSLVSDITNYSVLGEGKRLRPLLFVLSSELCGYAGKDVYRISTIFELIHSASLLHDDVLDNAETRRKKPAARNVWGNPAAVLAGDFLYAHATAIAAECNNLEFIKVLSHTTRRMVEGQFVELGHTHNWHLGVDKYLDIIIAKTAALISAACVCGGIIAGAPKEEVESLKEFGLNLGIAFQLIDDLLDYTSSEEIIGKPVGKDLREGKITLPLIYVLSDFEKSEVDKLEYLFKNHGATDKDYDDLIKTVRRNGVIERVRGEAKKYVDKGETFLELFPESFTKKGLLGLGEYIVNREL